MIRFARRALAALLMISVVACAHPPHAIARAAPAFEHWAFYVPYDPASLTSLTAHIDLLDDVVPDYFDIRADATITGDDQPSVDALIRAHGKGLLPMIQNSDRYAALDPLLNDPAHRENAVAAIVNLVEQYDYDGITLDFEAVDPSDRPGLTTFIQMLANALHAQGKQLAVAIPAKSGAMSTGWAGAFDYAAIGAVADRTILMAYAFRTASSSQPGPISPLPWVEDVLSYAVSVIPADHLLLGIGMWGYDWNQGKPGPAKTLNYEQTRSLVNRLGGQVSFHSATASASYTYQADGQTHQIWFENAASVRQKAELAVQAHVAGVAFWRLGQEAPGVWTDLAGAGKPDFAIPNGWFYTETAGQSGLGYRVTDNDGVKFWSEFQRLGGVATLGYPSSRRFVGSDGFTYQVFQRGTLQWRPKLGVAYLANTFEQLTAAGRDGWLQQQGIPPPILNDGSGGDWNRAREIRLTWLTNPAIAAAFYANPNPAMIHSWSAAQAIQLYGLPASQPVRSGPFIVQRFQRISLQLWVDSVPGMPAKGSVVGILGGDLSKQAGLVPADAAKPEPPG